MEELCRVERQRLFVLVLINTRHMLFIELCQILEILIFIKPGFRGVRCLDEG